MTGFTENDLAQGDYFDIIRYPSSSTRSGVFASIDDSQAQLSQGIWSLSYDEYVDADTKSVRLTYQKPCEGDFEPADGDVDGSDLAVFAADFGRTDCTTGPACEGDFDSDGDVDGSDLAVFAADFGRTDCAVSP